MADKILVLSSSPPRQFTSFSLSSSPPLPSMDEIIQKRPQILRTGSRAAPIPQNSSASFTSAASLFKQIHKEVPKIDAKMDSRSEDTTELKPVKVSKSRKAPVKKAEDDSKPAKKPRKPATTEGEGDPVVAEKKKSKPRAKKVVDASAEHVEKKATAPKPRTKKLDKDASATEVPKEKPARKPRAKKADGESQTKLATGKVTKASKAAISKLESSHPLKPKPEPEELDIQKALKRRVDWTPPVPTGKTAGIVALETLLSSGGLQSGEKRIGFADLFGSYGFTKIESNNGPTPIGTEITRKRKLGDLVKTNVSTAAAVSPTKEKAPKKKARTLTDQATSAYAEEEELPAEPAPLLQYFSLQTSERSTKDGFKIPPKPRSKSPAKATSKLKKGTAQAPILLSPESAMKQVGKQDFVFGTSSQLAREDSPTLLRDLHAAMQASNEEDPFVDSDFDSSPPVPKRRTGATTKRNLWSAASRDESGDLADVPMIDLVDSPAIDQQHLPTTVNVATPAPVEPDIWHDIGTTPAEPKVPGPIEAAIRTELSSPSGSRSVKSPRVAKVTKTVKSPSKVKSPAKPSVVQSTVSKSPAKGKKQTSTEMPNFAAYTNAQLAKEIASYHFKPVKKREAMIVLLQRCWESKNQAALSSRSTNLPIANKVSDDAPPSTQPVKDSPKRGRPRKEVADDAPPSTQPPKRGRPRKENAVQFLEMNSDTPLSRARTPKKAGKKSTQPTEDISDSDTPATPSPPRRSASQMSPLPLRKFASDLSDSPELSPGAAQELLFKHVSRAITSAPRSKDPFNPSWHEKILLYDPIVLEDLTIWLNTGALEKVGWDGEVEPKLIKKWCESNSICCLWRENLRGGARSRY